MKKIVIFTVVLAIAATTAVFAGRRVDDMDEDDMFDFVIDDRPEIKMLARNIRIDFKTVPADGDDKALYIVTGASHYETSIGVGNEEGGMEYSVEGTVEILDKQELFITYEFAVAAGGEDEAFEYYAASGVRLKAGEQIAVTSIDDKALVISASFVEPTAVRKPGKRGR